MKKGQELEVFIEKYEFGGVGVAYEGDKKVYVKGGVPGQKLNVRLTKKKKDYADGKLLEVVEKAPYEIDAPCPHFGVCGGCISQNVPYENQLKLKTGAVLDLFAKAGVSTGEFLGIEESPEIYEYRNKMEFSFGDLSKGGELQLGMHKKGSPFSVVTVDKCMLIDEDFRTILNYTLSYFREKNLPHYRIMQHEGYLRHFIIRKAKNADEIMVNLVTTSQIDENLTPWLEGLKSLNLKGKLVSVMHTVNDSLSDAVVPDKVNTLDGETFVTENILGLKFKISPFSFFQTNTKGTEKLYSIVRDFIGEEKKHIIFDLYCGTGTIGQVVSPYGEEIKGVEIIEEAVEAANENAKLNGLTNCNFIAGDVAKVIADLKGRPDLIILDPPRSGVHPKALEYVVKFNAKEIIYVSCNPKTLVTDLAYLEMHGYKVDKTKLMDMFPMTPHVETVVGLRRKDTL